MGRIAPLLPPQPPQPKGGHPWWPDRPAPCGRIFVRKTGIQWPLLPTEAGCGSGSTCWRRRLARAPSRPARPAGGSGPDRPVAGQRGPRQRPGKQGGAATGPTPTDRGKPGTKPQPATERRGIPLAAGLTGANRPDDTVFAPLVERIPPIKRPRGRPRERPGKPHADQGDDDHHGRAHLRRRGVQARLARKGGERSTQLGRPRWVVTRPLAWLHRFRRLTLRDERDEAWHQAFLDLGCALSCLAFLRGP